MTALVTKHLPLVAGAPDGIKKLRGVILELAVEGKLIPQVPLDESADGLLGKIIGQKHNLYLAKKLRTAPTQALKRQGSQVQMPVGWVAAQLSDVVALVTDGDHQPPPKAEKGVPFLVIGNLNTGSIRLDGSRFVPEDYFESLDWGRKPTKGDLLYTVTGSFGIPIIVDVDASFCVQRHVAILKTVAGTSADFLKIVLSSPAARAYAEQIATGIAQKTVPLTGLRQLPVALPPLAEQHRIIAKVDELMALCDRLEADQADAEAAHAQLVQALLDSLTQATDAADFRASWQRLSEHFHTLFTTEASIDALKQTVLQLAVMGKLVPHEVAGPEVARALPPGWCEQLINDFCTVQGGIQKTPLRRPVSLHFPYLRVANVQRGRIDVTELERYELTHDELAKWRLNKGDLLIVEGNGSENEIGRCAIWAGQVNDCVYQNHLMRVRPNVDEWVHYLAMYLNSPVGIGHMKRLAITTSGLFNLSVGKIRSIPVPLPPLAEQHRIVAKVDELLALCDQLKAQLAEARQQHAQLATVLVEQAVAA